MADIRLTKATVEKSEITVSAHEIAERITTALYKLAPTIPQSKRALVAVTIEEVLDRLL